ncbi:MAG: hypothetical protein JW754_04035 [Candidatus Aenigmarchaeota archaeon]|nr:hypothetical protein [Candidatus Aenigmarchaeota archaeon]
MAEKEDQKNQENLITKSEFEALESKEGKKKGHFSIFGKKSREDKLKEIIDRPDSRFSGGGDIDALSMKIEKIQAKMEMNDDLRKTTDERISSLSEEIGELRSALLEKEKTFNQMESSFKKIIDVTEEIKPEKIVKEIADKGNEIEKNQSRLDALDVKYEDMRKNVKEIKALLEKVKDIKKIFLLSEQLDEKINKVEEERRNITRMTGKIEAMFSEIGEKLKEFEKSREKIEVNSEAVYDLMKSLDALEVRIEKFADKEKLDQILDSVGDMKNAAENRIDDMKDIVDRLLENLKKAGIKQILKEEGGGRVDEILRAVEELNKRERVAVKLPGIKMKERREEKRKEPENIQEEISDFEEAPEESPGEEPEDIIGNVEKPEEPETQEEPEEPAEIQKTTKTKSVSSLNRMVSQIKAKMKARKIKEAKELYAKLLQSYEGMKSEMELDEYVSLYETISDLHNKLK